VIRFNCPHCGRPNELPDAMAHLTIVCKGCRQSVTVPEPSPEPEPPPWLKRPEPHHLGKSEAVVSSSHQPLPPPTATTETPAGDPTAHESASKPDSSANIDFNWKGSPIPEREPAVPALAAPAGLPAAPAKPAGSLSRVMPTLLDGAVAVILLVVGVLLGELLAQKSTREVWREAGSAPKFPPLELLQWLGPPLFLGLVYVLLMTRGLSVGSWLKRRQNRLSDPALN
jgi:hypothetical protein